MRPALALLLLLFGFSARSVVAATVHDRYFSTSDGVRLHYLEAGPTRAHTIVFVPGWTMPAWIWTPQIIAFARRYHVIAFDPRGQGNSAAPDFGYTPARRGDDIADLLSHTGGAPVLIVGWSLGVLDTLAYVHRHGDRRIAGLVLVDNSVGEEPPPHPTHPHPGPKLPRPAMMRHFVQGMFRHAPGERYLERLTAATLHTPEAASRALLSYPEPRSYWRDAVYSTSKPVLYVVRPIWFAQADNLKRKRPNTEIARFRDAGHALFVDDAGRFNTLLSSFITRRIWP
ncbi:MAG TPA: alpha/beta hydrolase [Acetobacteraceae bacterium]|nr:alpha/beta hydrolase [Acetobacteraceae bacterium]